VSVPVCLSSPYKAREWFIFFSLAGSPCCKSCNVASANNVSRNVGRPHHQPRDGRTYL
jgi:hypothetical protein